ncbi:MAG: GGDEF domain-containing protein [Rhodocyclaceae bacterium]|nr:GGDEF domain-containing protein [Rhodocyclaceae bacterium]
MTPTDPMARPAAADFSSALVSHGVGSAEMAAIRAFARVVEPVDFARDFAVALARLVPDGTGQAAAEQAQAAFCDALAACTDWGSTGGWFERVSAHWAECVSRGVETGFALDACASLVKAAARHLAGDRAVVYQLEMDILFAVDAFAWCVASLLSRQSNRHEALGPAEFADRDLLTGLPNRRCYARLLDDWLSQSGPERRVGLVVLGMEWGIAVQHLPMAERDRLRLAVTERLRAAVRAGDVLCATGEHEWSLLLPVLRSPAQVRLAANKLIAACEALLDGEFRELCGQLTGGGAVGPDHGRDTSALEYAARTALLVARKDEQRFEDYREAFSTVVDDTIEFEHELLGAIYRQELKLFLQPQVRFDDGRCDSAELLLRWRRSSGAWVPPPRIIDAAHRMGVLPKLSRWLIMHAAHMAAQLAELGTAIKVNLNVTAIDLRDDELPELVAQALETWRVPAGRFGIEVTETALVADHHRAAQLISRLRSLGCPVALDDFGTGFSSLAYLRNLPVTELKIDQLFVRQLGSSTADQAIVDAIMRLADGFGLQVVAEGVEDVDARELLRAAGCDLMQGYIESPAMPLEDFVRWWRLRNGLPEDVGLSPEGAD